MGLLTVIAGALVLFGWCTHNPALIQINPAFAPMQYNTALCFLMSGLSIIAIASSSNFAGVVFALFPSVIGLLTLIEYIFNVNIGIDTIFNEYYIMVHVSHPGRMAPNTALCFFLIGISLLLRSSKAFVKPGFMIVNFLASVVLGIGTVALSGYAVGIVYTYGWGDYTRMAIHTSAMFVLLSAGTLAIIWSEKKAYQKKLSFWPPFIICIAALTFVICMQHVTFIAGVLMFLLLGWVVYLFQVLRKINAELEQRVAERTEEICKLSRAVEQSPVSVVITDIKGNIEYVNPKFLQITGFAAHEVIGKNPRILKSGEQSEDFYKNLWAVITSGGGWAGEFHNRRKDGSLYWEHASISPIRSAQGEINHFLAVKEDITERKQMEDALKKANKELKKIDQLKSDFVSTVSHEIRTPMAVIKEAVSQVFEGMHGEITGQQKKLLAVSIQNVDRLARIVNNLLDVSKIESGKTELKKESVDISDLAKAVVSNFSLQAKNKGLSIQTIFPKKEIKLFIDKDKIIQVFTNLIDNAIKFTEKGAVVVSVEGKKDVVECAIRDTGIGMSGADLPRVFGKFQQFSRVDGPGAKGTGLGLSIARGIIELHNGKIWAESEINKGAKFTFTLPK